ncbi:MAG TPA: TonB-dependent receptor [Bacteroidia bacterium]|jgi:hypothetical protein
MKKFNNYIRVNLCNPGQKNLHLSIINAFCCKAITLLVIVFLLFAGAAEAQTLTQTIRGNIVDTDTKKPIEGASITVRHSEPLKTASSDANGQFRLNSIAVGRYDLKISSTGYEDRLISSLFIKSGKETVLTIELQSAIVNLKVVEINNKPTVQNEMATVSARSFSVEETKRYPASINDPARMVMSYAGVTSGYDRDNAIIIRGNSPKGLLWMLEGVEVPSPNHFSATGSSSGSVSMLSSTVLANSDFFTGAFPAGYGNATSGVFDIKLRNGNNEKREYTIQAGFLGVDVGAEGPFKKGKGASYLFNYRYSSTSIFKKLGYEIQGDAIPLFQDLSFKLFFPSKKAGLFSVYGLGGLSTVSQQIRNKKESYDYNIGVAGITHQYALRSNTVLKTNISFSDKSIQYRSEQKNAFNTFQYYRSDFTDYSLNFSMNITSRINTKNVIKGGITYSNLFYNYFAEDYYSFSPTRYIHLNEEDNTDLTQAYCSWKYRINSKLTLVNGVHFIRLGLNNRYSIEPRNAIKWEFGKNQSLSFGFGMHSKTEPLQTYLDKTVIIRDTLQLNHDLDFSRSRHYIISYDKAFTENLFFKAEAYYQELYNIPVSEDTTSSFSALNNSDGYFYGKLLSTGTGTNYGIELTIDKKFYKTYFFLITASLFESKYKGADKKERNTAFNTNYVGNLVIGKELWLDKKKKNILNTSLRGNWTGGRRYTPIDLEKSKYYNTEILKKDEAFSAKMDDYYRIDLQIGYIHNHAKFSSELRLDIQNLTNRKNVYSIYYDASDEEIKETYQLGLIPVLSYRIEF